MNWLSRLFCLGGESVKESETKNQKSTTILIPFRANKLIYYRSNNNELYDNHGRQMGVFDSNTGVICYFEEWDEEEHGQFLMGRVVNLL